MRFHVKQKHKISKDCIQKKKRGVWHKILYQMIENEILYRRTHVLYSTIVSSDSWPITFTRNVLKWHRWQTYDDVFDMIPLSWVWRCISCTPSILPPITWTESGITVNRFVMKVVKCGLNLKPAKSETGFSIANIYFIGVEFIFYFIFDKTSQPWRSNVKIIIKTM